MNLTAKVMVTLTLVIAVALITAVALIGRSTDNVYRSYVTGFRRQQLQQAADLASQRYAATDSWAAAQEELDRINGVMGNDASIGGHGQGRGRQQGLQYAGGMSATEFMLVDSASGARLTGDGRVEAQALAQAMPVIVDGIEIARVASVIPVDTMDQAEQALLDQVQRAILWSAVAAGLVALLLGALLISSILRPLRELEDGVAQVAAGDLDVRVQVRAQDEIGQLATNFNDMTANLQAQEIVRQRMVADIAHELRTPLSVVQGSLQAILDGVYPLEMDEVRALHDETLLLSRLVRDLHELAQAEARQLPLTRQQIPVDTVLSQMATRFRALADQREISINTHPPATPLTVDADADRLQQILHNLLGNAIRHTPDGGEIELGAVDDGPRVRFWVRNSGRGIPPAQIAHIFDRFYRGDASRTHQAARLESQTSEAGLGLAIAKALVQAHDGDIGVESEVGEYARFWFTLPRGQ